MTTLRQIESNRRNSKLSSGPRTELGKRMSRANSVTHGLSGRRRAPRRGGRGRPPPNRGMG